MNLPTLICIPLITSRADCWIEELGELRGKGEIFFYVVDSRVIGFGWKKDIE